MDAPFRRLIVFMLMALAVLAPASAAGQSSIDDCGQFWPQSYVVDIDSSDDGRSHELTLGLELRHHERRALGCIAELGGARLAFEFEVTSNKSPIYWGDELSSTAVQYEWLDYTPDAYGDELDAAFIGTEPTALSAGNWYSMSIFFESDSSINSDEIIVEVRWTVLEWNVNTGYLGCDYEHTLFGDEVCADVVKSVRLGPQ